MKLVRDDVDAIYFGKEMMWMCKCNRNNELTEGSCYYCKQRRPKNKQKQLFIDIVAGRVVNSGTV